MNDLSEFDAQLERARENNHFCREVLRIMQEHRRPAFRPNRWMDLAISFLAPSVAVLMIDAMCGFPVSRAMLFPIVVH